MTIQILKRDEDNLFYLKTVIDNKKKQYLQKIRILKKELKDDLEDWNKQLRLVENKIKEKIENSNNEKENLYLIDEINSLDL